MPYNYSNYSSLRYSATALKILLVGGFNPSEKYESQIGSSSQLLGKKMFQTTNQFMTGYDYRFINYHQFLPHSCCGILHAEISKNNSSSFHNGDARGNSALGWLKNSPIARVRRLGESEKKDLSQPQEEFRLSYK